MLSTGLCSGATQSSSTLDTAQIKGHDTCLYIRAIAHPLMHLMRTGRCPRLLCPAQERQSSVFRSCCNHSMTQMPRSCMDVSQHCHTCIWSQHTQGPPEKVRALAPCMQEVNLAEGRTTILIQMPMRTRHSELDPDTATHAWDASIQRGHQKSSGLWRHACIK